MADHYFRIVAERRDAEDIAREEFKGRYPERREDTVKELRAATLQAAVGCQLAWMATLEQRASAPGYLVHITVWFIDELGAEIACYVERAQTNPSPVDPQHLSLLIAQLFEILCNQACIPGFRRTEFERRLQVYRELMALRIITDPQTWLVDLPYVTAEDIAYQVGPDIPTPAHLDPLTSPDVPLPPLSEDARDQACEVVCLIARRLIETHGWSGPSQFDAINTVSQERVSAVDVLKSKTPNTYRLSLYGAVRCAMGLYIFRTEAWLRAAFQIFAAQKYRDWCEVEGRTANDVIGMLQAAEQLHGRRQSQRAVERRAATFQEGRDEQGRASIN